MFLSPPPDLHTAALLADLVEEKTGLFFAPNRYDILLDKLQPRMRERQCSTILDYYYLLKYDPAAEQEWQQVYAALAINETYFWREFDQIRAAAGTLVPEMLRSRPLGRVRIWHAACSSGEEPYSMVMALRETNPALLDQVEIFATDIDLEALNQAREGVYRQRSFRALPPELLNRYFTPLEGGRYQLDEEIRQHVTFSQLNLLDGKALSAMNNYDMIMCRNVFIYFKDSGVRSVVDSFYNALTPAGFLFVASAESLLRITNRFELIEVSGAFGYRKLPPVKIPAAPGFEVA